MSAALKILHVASFDGNIGDNANHCGFRPWFERLVQRDVVWSEFEIRHVYRKLTSFDEAFVELANSFDLVVIGGGNYFELWVDASPTGTSISIEDRHLAALKVPVFFNSLGVDDAQGVTPGTISRFNTFLGRLLSSDQFLVSVRNDGAQAALARHAGGLPLEKIVPLPDGGFFATYRESAVGHDSLRPHSGQRPRIGINLAGDMLDLRFPGTQGAHSYESFLKEFAGALDAIWQSCPDVRLIFFPHIFRDVRVYGDLLAVLPDRLSREHTRVAAYDPQTPHATFREYMSCDAVLGMRFHSNVVPLGNGVPTVGLSCYGQISRLYDELAMQKYVVDVTVQGFARNMLERFNAIRQAPAEVQSDLTVVKQGVEAQRGQAEARLRPWLAHHRLIAS